MTNFPVIMSADRQPAWPATVVGSITHTEGYCGAVVAERGRYRALGVDVEAIVAVERPLWKTICTSDELERLMSMPIPDQLRAAALVFAAKEAFYKCQYPVLRQWLDFDDVVISTESWSVDAAPFCVLPHKKIAFGDLTRAPLQGRFSFENGRVFAGIAVDAAA